MARNKPDASLAITLPGKDIRSSDYVNDYVFAGGLPTMQIKKRIKLSLTTDPGNEGFGTAKYQHGFGYKPQTICFVTTRTGTIYPNSYINVPQSWQDYDEAAGAVSNQVFDCWVDEQFVYVSAYSNTFVPMVGVNYREDTYTFDILLMMEEALTV